MERLSYQKVLRGYTIQAEVVYCGNDLFVIIAGGDSPHIGAVAVAVSAPSIKDPTRSTVTPYLFTVSGHKEYRLALSAAQRLSMDLDRTVVVSVGVHIDDITAELIDLVVEGVEELVDELVVKLRPK